MPKCVGLSASNTDGKLAATEFDRREVGPKDVKIDIHYCGICHSDLHMIKNEWGITQYPAIVGHEITGLVAEVGSEVSGFTVGQKVAVGCMVNSCRTCTACKNHEENYCPGMIQTYNMKDVDGTITRGGYSSFVVVDQDFVLRFPDNLPMDAGAPLLCAGITTYSPLMHFGLNKPGMKVGVIGLGGLGHMAVKIGAALGLEITVISTSESKREQALSFGAKHFLVSKDSEAMAVATGTLDGIIDTVSAHKPMSPYINLLAVNGKIVCVGAPPEPFNDISSFALIFRRVSVAGSLIGGVKETQEMLDFCAKHNITCEIEKISADYINTAMERLEKNDVRYRFVIDIKGTLNA